MFMSISGGVRGVEGRSSPLESPTMNLGGVFCREGGRSTAAFHSSSASSFFSLGREGNVEAAPSVKLMGGTKSRSG